MKMPSILSRAISAMPGIRSMIAPTPYEAGDHHSAEMGNWLPELGSPDGEFTPSRDTIVARTRDVGRNTSWGKSALDRHVDSVIGDGWMLSASPNYRALGLTPTWAEEFSDEVEAKFKLFAEDPDFYVDATRNDDLNGLMRIGYKQRFRDGETLALALWLDDKPNNRYATTIQMVDTDRLSNPNGMPDTEFLRGGIEYNRLGEATHYNFSKAHPADVFSFGKNFQWERVAKEDVLYTPAGVMTRRRVLHGYEKDRPSMSRGVSAFAAVLSQGKMLHQYSRLELQRAITDASISTYISSPMDHEFLAEMLSDNSLGKYQDQRSAFHSKRNIRLGGVRIPKLFPGEDIKMIGRNSPSNQFEAFWRAMLRNVAAALGISYEQLTQDWSQVNYSSARAAMMEIWKSMASARADFGKKFATPIYMLWLQEGYYRGDIETLRGQPDFETAKAAYCRCEWIGAPRGYVDPEKEAIAQKMRMENRTSTLKKECAEQGLDWKEVLDQLAMEYAHRQKLGLPENPEAELNQARETARQVQNGSQ